MKYVVKSIHAFNKWFCSHHAIWQTLLVTVIWVAIEMIFPKIDPNGFILLYILTILSFVTQPMLAYASSVSAEESKKSQDMLEQLMRNNIDLLHATIEVIENQQKTIDKLNEIVGHIAKEVEEISEEINE